MTAGAGIGARAVQPRAPLRATSRSTAEADVWRALRKEAEAALIEEPLYAGVIQATILDKRSFALAIAYRLAHRLGDGDFARLSMRDLCLSAFEADPDASGHAVRDLVAIRERDPTCRRYLDPLLFYKGFAALEGYRVAHWLWHQGRAKLALHVQSRISEVFGCDVHPATRIGSGVFIDHATMAGVPARVVNRLSKDGRARLEHGPVVRFRGRDLKSERKMLLRKACATVLPSEQRSQPYISTNSAIAKNSFL